MSLVIADYFRNLGGKKQLDKAAVGLGKMIGASNIFKAETAHNIADNLLKTLALCSGGWILVAPMKGMEDKKRPIVHWLNKKMGVDMTAPDGHQETADEIYIENEQPPQSWGNAFMRRLKAQITVSITGLALNMGAAKKLESPVTIDGKLTDKIGGEQRMTDFIVNGVNKGLKSTNVPGSKFLTTNPRAQAYIKFASLDTFYTMITAKVMHLTNGAGKLKLPHEIGDEKDPPGVLSTNEIVFLPKGETFAETTDDTPQNSEDKLAKYKKSPIRATQTHTDLANSGDIGAAMTP